VPYSIDAWTGEATQLADYRWEDGKTVVPIDLDYDNIALMAFEKVNPGQAQGQLHVLDTNADSAYATEEGVAVRTSSSGTVTAQLSDGNTVNQPVEVPAAYDITGWDLNVKSWRPNPTAGDLIRTETIDGLTTTNRKTSTVVTDIDVELDTLTTWDKIPEVGRAVSGKGYYEATFDWDADSATGAYIDFGKDLEDSMVVWINGEKVGGEVSTNPTKVRKDVGGVGKPTIDDGRGNQVPLVGTDLYTGGVNWATPIADVSNYLVDGQNEIKIEYSSALANVQLDRGIVTEAFPRIPRGNPWWMNDVKYLSFGPQQAKLVPFVDVEYSTKVPGPPTTVPPTTVPPTTVPPATAPPVTPKVRVKDKVRAGTMLKIRGRDLTVGKVSITLGGKKLGTAEVEDGRFAVSRKVPNSLKGRTVLRVLDRKGEVLVRVAVRVVRRKAA
jgi:hypothetical protein